MSWMDEARLKIAKREEKQKAEAATKAKEWEAQKTRMMNLVAAALKRLLPPGVELVGLPIIGGCKGDFTKSAGARINLGNGVQFNLLFQIYCDESGDLERGSSIAIYEGEGEPNNDRSLSLYRGSCDTSGFWSRFSLLRLTRTEVKEMLFVALEKHNLRSG